MARRDRGPLPFLALVLALLLPGPARGNEGGAASSCKCRKYEDPPQILTNYSDRLESCDTCQHFTRFNFPKTKVCGWKHEPWVISFKYSLCHKGHLEEGAGRTDASRGHHHSSPSPERAGPALTSPSPKTAGAAPASPSSAGISPGKSQETPRVAASPTDAAWVLTMAGSPLEPSAEAAARGALEEERAAPPPVLDVKTAVITLICVALLSVGFAVSVLCWRRQQRGGSRGARACQTPLEEEEGALCLPGEKT